jgi:hypothetical protein
MIVDGDSIEAERLGALRKRARLSEVFHREREVKFNRTFHLDA